MTILLQLVFLTSVANAFTSLGGNKAHLRSVRSSGISLKTATVNIKDVVETNVEPAKEEKFDWFKAWYPVVPVEILDPEKPHRFQLLGQDIVVWNDRPVEGGLFGPKKNRPKNAKRLEGAWRAFVDECPHRKVPLSEGRVEDDGTLLCSYHAWRFDGEGSCVAVPQIENENELQRVLKNPKTNCNSFPTKVINGVLFVWPSSDENAVLESELTPVQHRVSEKINNGSDRVWEGPWNYRELPYGADWFIENVVDGAHVSVSHHNVVGSRYGNQHLNMKTSIPVTKDGFTIEVSSPLSQQPSYTNFYAPSMVAIDTGIGKDGAKQTLELYVSPSRPGFCNHVGRMVIVKDESGKTPQLLRQFTLPIPKWLNHIMASAFLNQDALFLHHQERSMHKTGQYSSLTMKGENEPYHYTKAVYPINTDQGVINFRNWLRKIAGGYVPYKNNPTMPEASNDIVFDVWNSHTKHCKYCQDALRRLKKVRLASFFVSVCFGVLRPVGKIGSLVSAIGFAGLGLLINKLIGFFYKYEFSHAHND